MINGLANYSSSKLFELLMVNESPLSIALLTPDLKYARINKTLCNIIGMEEKDIIGKHCYELISKFKKNRPRHCDENICEYCVSMAATQTGQSAEMVQEFSSDLIAHVLAYPLKDSDGNIIGTMELIENITEKVNDPLTGAKNYRFFEESLSQECHRIARIKAATSLVILDLDNFKQINDIHGHSFGDKILKEIANTLLVGLRKSDKLCRIGGDEFGIILPDSDKKEAQYVAKRLLDLIKQTFSKYELSFCYGIASLPKDGNDTKTLKEFADSKLYEQKDNRVTKTSLNLVR